MVSLVTELVNQTDKTIGFEEVVDDEKTSIRPRWYMPLKDLAPNKTTNLILPTANDASNLDYNILLLMDGKSTGKKVDATYFIACVRIIFKYDDKDEGVLILQGVREKHTNYADLFLRMRGLGRLLGSRRKWDKRPLIDIELEQDPTPIPLELQNDRDARMRSGWNGHDDDLMFGTVIGIPVPRGRIHPMFPLAAPEVVCSHVSQAGS